VQAAGEEYLAWPLTLTGINIEGFIHIALRAVAFANRNTLVNDL